MRTHVNVTQVRNTGCNFNNIPLTLVRTYCLGQVSPHTLTTSEMWHNLYGEEFCISTRTHIHFSPAVPVVGTYPSDALSVRNIICIKIFILALFFY